jgi:CheY-like chemotaxis protein
MAKKILYIEDNTDNRILIKRVLEAENYQVIEAENGRQGIEQAKTTHPDLILIDINLPDIDGYNVTKQLREIPYLAKTPILAITANVMKPDLERTIAAGCDGYIPKPVDVDLLPQQIAEYI